MSQLLQDKIFDNYCKVHFLVVNHLHRLTLDANREVLDAAQGETIAIEAWYQFHNLINFAQNELSKNIGTTTVNTSEGSPITGINAILFDVHGYAGKDWVDVFGSPLVQWAYRMNDGPSLETCPLDDRSSGTIGTLTHARWRKFSEGSFCRCIEYCCNEFPG
ncbi:predicted protein [Thalassiosira pseudonana CCMP1335]|jgi:hypothetical protein|uniref:Uncharacterized protein n=1 Tax=Thalassiosira pseudonana TaxID=35128 RepID=B8CEI3_THAPS|nr:predicted protein [Thalassiosira pseudonana CCMP1335]EED87908.1 predicted protein [Thalassiosira pseudonana CCMP1335]